jgi:nicotinate-nucleotide adenylyltransferase
MLSLAVAGQPAFRIDELEKDRPGPSYTADSLREIQGRYAGARLSLLIGADTLHDLPHWYEPARIVALADLVVVPRSDWLMLSERELRQALELGPDLPLRMQLIHMPTIGISSRDLRRRAADGRSLRYLVPRAVEEYIHDKKLYKEHG